MIIVKRDPDNKDEVVKTDFNLDTTTKPKPAYTSGRLVDKDYNNKDDINDDLDYDDNSDASDDLDEDTDKDADSGYGTEKIDIIIIEDTDDRYAAELDEFREARRTYKSLYYEDICL
ncbi:hypothetical protein G7Y89_g5512 [Cudoniella acicularis]|uniref:Uncharacterized protein n=1 Tax=Cudoniella acicularis TaxID=354080 RepID=A0A8H4RMB8_9HELO|nr:hypothetical protein G7Y89_g5512 [Cudoniella acicularis]